jgi:hypothetical protein
LPASDILSVNNVAAAFSDSAIKWSENAGGILPSALGADDLISLRVANMQVVGVMGHRATLTENHRLRHKANERPQRVEGRDRADVSFSRTADFRQMSVWSRMPPGRTKPPVV